LREAGGEVRKKESVVDGFVEVVASNGNGRLQEEFEEILDRNVRAD